MTDDETFLNFAYGSNMSIDRLRARAGSARVLAVGWISGHELRWHKRGMDGSGKCDAYETTREDHVVRGAVMKIAACDRDALDRAEGLGSGYEQRLVDVETPAGRLRAWMFYATDIAPELEPFDWYKDYVLRGARELALPAAYIARIARVATRHAEPASFPPLSPPSE